MPRDDSDAGMDRLKAISTAALWLAVPFPTYCALVFLAQPALHKLIYGTQMGIINMSAMTWWKGLLAFSAVLAIAVTGAVVAATSWELAKGHYNGGESL